ncbi:MAG TPA: hypothetical protein VEG30_15525 [Terriglobales bacterium]|nr:hypothetical protein [Terriglobales bacterium]
MARSSPTRVGPRIACEITPERVIAARVSRDGNSIETYAVRTLAHGAVVPSLTEANLTDSVAVKHSIREAMAAVGERSHDVAAILPDAAVRIALLDFDSLPEKKEEQEATVRFRLKKTLPFDVEHAVVSYDTSRVNGSLRVMAAVVLSSVLEEYERQFRELGFSPGVVLPSMLAALGNVSGEEPTMVVKVDTVTTSIAISGNGQVLLFRTLENPRGSLQSAEELVEAVHPSLVFFQDTYGMAVSRILVAGLVSAEQLAPALNEHTGIRVDDLVSSGYVGSTGSIPKSILAGVVGALVS